MNDSLKLELRFDLIKAVTDEARMNYQQESDKSKWPRIILKTIFENPVLYEHEKEFMVSSFTSSNHLKAIFENSMLDEYEKQFMMASSKSVDDEKYVVKDNSWYQPQSTQSTQSTESTESVPIDWKTNNFLFVNPSYSDKYKRSSYVLDNALMHTIMSGKLDDRYNNICQMINLDDSLTSEEKVHIKNTLLLKEDRLSIGKGGDAKYICEQCNRLGRTLTTCEHCMRDILISNFDAWTSGNAVIDSAIQQIQKRNAFPYMFPEWIQFDDLDNINFKTKGGFATVFTAQWKSGFVSAFDPIDKTFIRSGSINVILKHLKGSNNDHRYLNELHVHLSQSSKMPMVVKVLGITRDPCSKDFMLVLEPAQMDLLRFCQGAQYTWRDVYKSLLIVTAPLEILHSANLVHHDLHPGNILIGPNANGDCYLSDFGLSGPPGMSSDSIYGSLPFIATEVLRGHEYTVASDIYSFGMLMWTFASSVPPFYDQDYDTDLTIKIMSGLRPPPIPGIPGTYEDLMKRCWDDDPNKRPSLSEISGYFLSYILGEKSNFISFFDNTINKIPTRINRTTSSKVYPILSTTTSSVYSISDQSNYKYVSQEVDFDI